MLRTLEIRDILIIDRLVLEPGPGLNVLTGETGAGKSILLDALGLVLGWRGRADTVRPGREAGEVTAIFDLPADSGARAVLAGAGIEVEGGDLILRRVAQADGRRQAFANDRRVSTATLRELSAHLVELHGQNDDRGLLNPRGHRALLDAFAGLDLRALSSLWDAARAAREALAGAEAEAERARRDEDFLRHAVAELDRLAPQPGEDAALDAARRRMQAAERIRADIARALAALSDDGAGGRMRDARRWLEAVATGAQGRLDGALAALARAEIELGEAEAGVESCLEALDFSPGALESAEERLFAIRALARKHGIAPDELATHADALRGRLDALDAGTSGLARLRRTLAEAESAWQAEAARISAARREGAGRLDAMMVHELAPLKLGRARFHTEITPCEPGPDGADRVTFTVSTGPGLPPGPLNRIASGGEMSRFLLALKACLSQRGAQPTLIFDEIDRGVGGATADAVGRRLKALAGRAQVLVVTHSPQVAARAAQHWRVERRITGGETLSTVTALAPAERVEEIARMLAGDVVTDAARAAAAALLAA